MIPEREEVNGLGLGITSAYSLEKGSQPSQAVMKSGDSQESEVVFLACGEASGSPGKQKLVRSIRQSPGEGEAA